MALADRLEALLALPSDEQVAAARALIASLDPTPDEAWNTTFGPGSLFDAWTQTSIAQSVHAALAERIRPIVRNPAFVAIEVGAGDGRMWSSIWKGDEVGELVVVDLVPDAIDRLAATVPEGVRVVRALGSVADVDLPPSDLIVCSMTLHHVAGRDAEERAAHGLTGPGKREILQAFRESLRPRGGLGLLVEADVDCEVHLAPGDPLLLDNIFDSYMRRCGRSILHDLRHRDASPTLVRAWTGLLHHWFLGQIAVADAPITLRDVYELRVPQWLELLGQAGFQDVQHEAADRWKLFELYELRVG